MHHQHHRRDEQDAHRQGEIHALAHVQEQTNHHPADQGGGDGDFAEGQRDAAHALLLQADQLGFAGLQHEQVVDDAGGARTQHAEVGDQGADQKHGRYGHRDDVAQGLRRHLWAAHRLRVDRH